ncbi:MAG: hypothetical protein AUI14_02315 [Actinobacteria bacterium 13_2_20CM_2_71_6]|nr:MAG: hypothetical protein AUI14_02315 [Actinobacteria bacterium 13_2_20CM_2_71_6]
MNPEDLDTAFRTLKQRVSVVPPAPEEIFIRGRHRQAMRLALACVVVLMMVVAGGYAATARPWSAPQPATTPAPTPSTQVPWQATDAIREDPSRLALQGFLLHQTDGPDRVPDVAHTPCWAKPLAYGNDNLPVGRSSINGELYVYPDEDAARAVFATVQKNVPSCVGFDAPITKWSQPPLGDEAVSAIVPLPADGAGEFTGQPLQMIVVRVGTAIGLTWGYPLIPQIEADARALSQRMCLYSPRCQPRAGLPAALPALREGGQAWAAVLRVEEPPKYLGSAVAAAADLGYRASTASADCDEGARLALGVPTGRVFYAVVYFASQADAEALARMLPGVRVFPVRTHCVG